MTMNAWKALAGRITLFPGPGILPVGSSVSALELYKKAWGGNPDNYQQSNNALSPTIAQGNRADMMVGCAVHPSRIDFTLSPIASREQVGTPFVVIEGTLQFHAEVSRLIQFVGGGVSSDPINRAGVFLHFVQLASNINEANELLTSVIPEQYRARITSEEDFVFQINRPQTSVGVEGVRMNYITKWSVDRFQVFNFAFPIGVAGSPNVGPMPIKDFIAASVTFDNNNVPAHFALDYKQQSSLLSEGLKACEEMQKRIGLRVEGF